LVSLVERHDESITRHGTVFARRYSDGTSWTLEVWALDAGTWKVAVAQVTSTGGRRYTTLRVF
jgi:hypothetical protein